MKLYHFTSCERLAGIVADGMIRTTESNVSETIEHAGPDVVWLTDEPAPRAVDVGLDRTLDGTDKRAVRITVEIPDHQVIWWSDFATAHGVDRGWRRALERGRDPESWWVVERAVLTTEIVAIDVEHEGAS